MKKIEYMTPEMEVLDLKLSSTILNVSTGAGDPAVHTGEDNIPDPDEPVIGD